MPRRHLVKRHIAVECYINEFRTVCRVREDALSQPMSAMHLHATCHCRLFLLAD